MPHAVTLRSQPATGRHRAPGRNWAGLVSAGPGRHSATLQRRTARHSLLLQVETELHDRIATMPMSRVVTVAG